MSYCPSCESTDTEHVEWREPELWNDRDNLADGRLCSTCGCSFEGVMEVTERRVVDGPEVSDK